jgi:hypothetical protein
VARENSVAEDITKKGAELTARAAHVLRVFPFIVRCSPIVARGIRRLKSPQIQGPVYRGWRCRFNSNLNQS